MAHLHPLPGMSILFARPVWEASEWQVKGRKWGCVCSSDLPAFHCDVDGALSLEKPHTCFKNTVLSHRVGRLQGLCQKAFVFPSQQTLTKS